MKVGMKALPDWMMRREKRQSAALLGHSASSRVQGRARTRGTSPVLVRSRLASHRF